MRSLHVIVPFLDTVRIPENIPCLLSTNNALAVTTAVFSTCGMGFWTFAIAAVLSLPKQFVTVYLGVALEQSADGVSLRSLLVSFPILTVNRAGKPSRKDQIIKWTILILTGVVTIGAMWYINKQMTRVKPDVIYARRKARYVPVAVVPPHSLKSLVTGNTRWRVLHPHITPALPLRSTPMTPIPIFLYSRIPKVPISISNGTPPVAPLATLAIRPCTLPNRSELLRVPLTAAPLLPPTSNSLLPPTTATSTALHLEARPRNDRILLSHGTQRQLQDSRMRIR